MIFNLAAAPRSVTQNSRNEIAASRIILIGVAAAACRSALATVLAQLGAGSIVPRTVRQHFRPVEWFRWRQRFKRTPDTSKALRTIRFHHE
jgi:hypothetical protein